MLEGIVMPMIASPAKKMAMDMRIFAVCRDRSLTPFVEVDTHAPAGAFRKARIQMDSDFAEISRWLGSTK
jgi:hypothetical protein